MRLCTCTCLTVLAVATAAALVGGTAADASDAATPVSASAAPTAPTGLPRPTCTTPPEDTPDATPDTDTNTDGFPVRTRIHGGPASYDAGGGYRTWSLDLTNTTTRTCRNIHPVIVLVDGKRTLRAAQPRLEFYEGTRPYPVSFERTDADELVGVLDHQGFPGFTVPPGHTVTVRLRLAVTSGAAVPNDVVANAAVVQRRGNDGEWVGESNDYRFRIVDGGREGYGDVDGYGDGDGDGGDEGGSQREDQKKDTGAEEGTTTKEGTGIKEGTATKEGTGIKEGNSPGVREEDLPFAELARTGANVMPYATGLLLLAVGAVLVALVRRKSC